MILALRTDAPTAELRLLSDDGREVGQESWLAERRLAKELLGHLEEFLKSHDSNWDDLTGLIVFQGPGSFTGLRIGITVMNTIAYAQSIPIIGVNGEDWIGQGVKSLVDGKGGEIALPAYGADVHITQPRK